MRAKFGDKRPTRSSIPGPPRPLRLSLVDQSSHRDPHPYSAPARLIMKLLARHGGCLRIAALARAAGLQRDELCETINDLAQLFWLRITWRRTPHAALPARLRDAERVTLTRLGRARLPVPWEYPKRPRGRRRRSSLD
jgi:hypothetical protein